MKPISQRNALIEDNLRLIHHLLHKKFKVRRASEYDELFQVGTLGLLRAAQLYDPAREVLFSTYACIWIHQAISRHLFVEKRRKERLKQAIPLEDWRGRRAAHHLDEAIVPEEDSGERSEQIENWLRHLKPEDAKLIRDRLAGRTLREIGKEEGVVFQAIQNRYDRALARLRVVVNALENKQR